MSGYVTTVQSNGKLKRGPVVSIPNRKYSEPIPDSILAALDAAALVLDDNDHTYTLYFDGRCAGVMVWGAAERHWHVRFGRGEPSAWKSTRDDALVALIDAYQAANR